MFKKWYGLKVGLITFAVLAAATAFSRPAAHATKPPKPPTPPPPPPPYTMQWVNDDGLPTDMLTDPTPGACDVLGMNNLGDVLIVFWHDEGGDVLVWKSESNEWKNLGDAMLDDPGVIVPSAELEEVLGYDEEKWHGIWPGVVNHNFEPSICPHAINDAGQVAGSFWFVNADGNQVWHACRYTPAQDGESAEFIDLGIPDGYEGSNGCAINNSGDVSGRATRTAIGSFYPSEECPFVWRITDTAVETFRCGPGPGQPGSFNAAVDINDLGQAAGVLNLAETSARAFRYTPPVGDSPELYEDLGVLYSGGWSWGLGINSSGQVAGWSPATATGTRHAFRYTDGPGMVDLGTLGRPTQESVAWDLNDEGQVVGYAYAKVKTVFLFSDATGMLDLTTLIDSATLPPATTTSNISGQLYVNNSVVVLTDGKRLPQICGTISIGNVERPFVLKASQ